MKVQVEKQIGKGVLSFETGFLAKQAAACVLVRYGDTVVLNAVATGAPRPGIDFFPLMCDYRERTSAAGKFPGGFLKREGRPTTKETLTARLTDRPLRPLFPKGFNDEVQCQSFVFSSDKLNDADVLAMNGAAAACHISPLPFNGPVSSIRLGRVGDQWIPFPTVEDLEESELDLIVSGSKESVLMIEGFAREMPEELMLEAIAECHKYIREICDLQQELYNKVGVVKQDFVPPPDDGIYAQLKSKYYDDLKAAQQTVGKQARADAVRSLKERVIAEMVPDPEAAGALCPTVVGGHWHELEGRVVRDLILAGTRSDGRDGKTLRPIECYVNVLPRTHGSAVFQRGETQTLISVTLGTSRDEQRVDGLGDEYSKKFMLDYNFPPFSVGECRPIRGPGRREIGHGALAERSVAPVLPSPDDFPYTIRVISDILESNGSSSMASVCGATLGLMDAGVPISNPVAGISVGLVYENDEHWTLLTDILGSEDHYGDMDFKIAGTQNGITGIQLDLKIDGISNEVIKATLTQSREARIDILRSMLSTIPRPKEQISEHAPRLLTTKIPPDKIGMLIGPGGKNIRGIQESTGAVIEVDDDGVVTIASSNAEWAQKALEAVEAVTASVQIGKIYQGRVTSVKDFGAFVEILPGRDGLCHISELDEGYVSNVTDICNVGDTMRVLVIDVDDHDRVKLSRKRAQQQEKAAEAEAQAADTECSANTLYSKVRRALFAGLSHAPRLCHNERSPDRNNGWVAMSKDLEEEVRRLREQYHEIAELAGALAHEIKNPLSVIGMNMELLREDLANSEAPEVRRTIAKTEIVQKQCLRLQNLLDDFLRFARVRHLDLTPGSLNERVERVLDLFAPQARENRVEIVRYLDADLPSILMDEQTIEAALVNLVKNAIEAMPDGGQLTVRTRQTRRGVALDLIDTGRGMDQGTAMHMFEAFFTTKDGGSGLGLPTARKGIEAHGGRIDVQSAVDKGTKFTLEFPMPGRIERSVP